ncbi:unnamed protein product [Penicillium olsonii]|nr:unnamed protein product [Penicillium olsonii]
MDPFQRLPTELVLQIIADTADFTGVENLISVSRKVRAVFQCNSREIMQAVSSSNPMTSQPEIKRLVSNAAVICNPSIQCSSLHEYRELTATNDKLYSAQRFQSPEVACRMLHVAAQIQALACACLTRMRENLVSGVGSSPADAQGARRPFSWIEEYRMYWALWHIRCYSELRKAVGMPLLSPCTTDDSLIDPRWKWPYHEMQALNVYHTFADIFMYRVEAIWTVAVVLDDLGVCSALMSHGVIQPEHRSTISWVLPPNEPLPSFSSFNLPRRVGIKFSTWSPPQPPSSNPATKIWHLTPDHCTATSPQTSFFRSLHRRFMRPGSRRYQFGINNISLYRLSGVLIWDTWRLFTCGLYYQTRQERLETPDGGFLEPEPVFGFDNPRPWEGSHIQKWLQLGGAKE